MATYAGTDPRIKLYFETVTYIQLLRYEFSSWTPLSPQTRAFKNTLDKLQTRTPKIYDVPSIQKLSNRCYKCSRVLKSNECLLEICSICHNYIDNLPELCDRFPRKPQRRFEKILSDQEIRLITCFKCRRIGHICEM